MQRVINLPNSEIDHSMSAYTTESAGNNSGNQSSKNIKRTVQNFSNYITPYLDLEKI